ncbi:MAG: penicillin-binding protein 2 [Flavobacteriaceae bacterium]|nr:penicillin-binding protein 2 [Flavobacteriaceae bacterium]MDG1911752.1 penicillin-binding protein 2 [Flavobacteriaceae bacterium]
MIRKGTLLIFTVGACFLFIFQLMSLQLFNSDYTKLSENNAVEKRPIYPKRGLIYDRNGTLMVANQPVYDLMVVPENIEPFDTLELIHGLSISKDELLLQLKKAKRFSSKLPSVIIRQVSKEDRAMFQEKIWKYPGFYFQKKLVRDYVLPIASNLLGYTSEVNTSEVNKKNDYALGEMIGRQGIEKTYENSLRGKKGASFFQKDRFNRIIGPYQDGRFDTEAESSEDLNLTIDAVLQQYGESLLRNKRGGIVAIEPQTGEVLALVTAPSYDPNVLIGRERSKNFSVLVNDTLAKPLFDRGLQAEYSPGSPFKTLNALIGLQEKVITPNTQFECDQGHFYARNAFMKCHCAYGSKNDLIKGIYNSCNTYFAKTYVGIVNKAASPAEGVDRWRTHLEKFGLGDYLGYDLPIGKKGFIPNSTYYDRWYQQGRWGGTTIISNAIGQGEILTTPIQMANFTATIANRGYFIKPHFKKSFSQKEKDSLFPKNYTLIAPQHFETVVEGMHQVVEKGTARIARIKGIEVCGKTGTVENFIRLNNEKTQLTDHSIFVAFAPKDDPKIAITVFVENGYWGGRWAAPIASLMIEKYLTGTVNRKWLENRMLNGSLLDEYAKPLSGKPFAINE